ncbi:MAG: transcription-repair coupling factor, partial [Oscillospiraceae bacterium]|nr:transcription-repair coupling factor [Oscillospiraceae bacterium]
MLSKPLEAMREYRKIKKAIAEGDFPIYVTGLSQIHKANLISALSKENKTPALIITHDDAAAAKLYEDIKTFFGEEDGEDRIALYPSKDYNLRGADGISREYEHDRLKVLGKCVYGGIRIIVASAEAVLQYTVPPDVLEKNTMILQSGDEIKIKDLLEKLVSAGYSRTEQVEGVCQFASRGGIVDVYPPNEKSPIRIEFWGDEIDSVNYFDTFTQRRTDFVEKAVIIPARETLYKSCVNLADVLRGKLKESAIKKSEKAAEGIKADIELLESGAEPNDTDKYLPIIYKEPCTLFNYLPDALLFVSEYARQKEILKNVQKQLREDISILFEEGGLFKGLDKYCMDVSEYESELKAAYSIFIDNFLNSMNEIPIKQLLSVVALQLAPWSGDYKVIEEELSDYLSRGYCVAIMGGIEKSARILAGDLREKGINAVYAEDVDAVEEGKVYVLSGGVSAGIEYPEIKFAVISNQKNGEKKGKLKRKTKSGEDIKSLSDLTPGDYVVHVSHGVGIFEGIVKKDLHGVVKDYIRIKYGGGDVLFVPVTQLDLVAKYIGPRDDGKVKLNKLNSGEWSKTRARVKHAAKDMAKELLQLYGERQKTPGYAFSSDSEWQREFEERFPYEETDDQLKCVEEIKDDMERGRPMDRLLCGDVGFGKTEVAIRAAFKCVMDSKQCAVLAP